MADDAVVIRGINYRQTFPFTNIFRSFRVAIHLSKLFLGLALLLSIYFWGRALDGVWPARALAVPGEIAQYEQFTGGGTEGSLKAWREEQRAKIEDDYAGMLMQFGVDSTPEAAKSHAQSAGELGLLDAAIEKQRNDGVIKINSDYTKALTAIDAKAADADKQRADLAKQRDQAVSDAYAAASDAMRAASSIDGEGLFDDFFEYEIRQVTNVVNAVAANQWLGEGGVVSSARNFFAVGPVWLAWNHLVFFILFAVVFLLAWSVFGGAISRIAAVQVARDEKISVRQAMNFSVGKLLSFASAPVIPLLIVVAVGLLVSVVALIGNIPFLGPIVIGALFSLALLAGFVMTLVLLGAAGGFNLMYPTIAVEGSDSFDAISRSFSYVYARPWRMLFYTAIAVAYGAATYMFIHLFIWTMLVLTHHFVSMGMFRSADNTHDLFNAMWPNPLASGRLSYSVDHTALSFGQNTGSYLIQCWVMLLVSFLGAYAISLFFSANTIIYYLMRSEVDATEMDDVFLEQQDEEMESMPSAPTPPAPAPASLPNDAATAPPPGPTPA